MSEPKTVLEIVAIWLKENGYDGLYDDEECGCLLDDLAPCDGCYFSDCQAGYRHKDTSSEFGFFVGPLKEKG